MADIGSFGDFFGSLGDLAIGTLRNQYLPANVAPPVTIGAPSVTRIPGTGGVVTPAIPVSCDGGPAPVYKKVNGIYQWVKPRRRRRKKLLRESDARGLAQLKGIVGTGKVMEVWIATHGG